MSRKTKGKDQPRSDGVPPEPRNNATLEKKPTFAESHRAELKQQFLDQFKEYGTIYHTAKAIGSDHSTIEKWLNNDAAFAEAFKTIRKAPGYMIERAAIERAKNPSNQADTMRIFMLKNLLPESYGEADKLQIELTVSNVLVAQFVSIVQANVPDTCPHCKTNLGLSAKLASELSALSESMLKAGAIRDANARA